MLAIPEPTVKRFEEMVTGAPVDQCVKSGDGPTADHRIGKARFILVPNFFRRPKGSG